MDRRERGIDLMAGVLAALQGLQASIYTALPGIIQSFDPAKRTVTIQPTLQAQVQAPDGSKSWVTLPLLVDCPVFYPGGGGFTLTFPLAAGDETLVIFASRCIDAWWQSGGIQVQAEIRMHDLSDGFCFAGISSVPNVQPAISTSNVQLRSDDGLSFYELDPGGNANIVCAGNLTAVAASATVTAPIINLVGNVTITGNLAVIGTFTNNGVNVGSTHTHPINSGSSSPGPTGAPT